MGWLRRRSCFIVIYVTSLLISISSACERSMSCPCGSSNTNQMLCVDDVKNRTDPCSVWSHCRTCLDYETRCVSCHPSRAGADCSIGYCPDPGDAWFADKISDGSVFTRPRDFFEGKLVIFNCRNDMALDGSSILKCQADGTWSAPLPRCVSIQTLKLECPDPGTPRNGEKVDLYKKPSETMQVYLPGDSVAFSCHSGYLLHGQSFLRCLSRGIWSNRRPRCVDPNSTDEPSEDEEDPVYGGNVFCEHPGVDINGDIDHSLLDARSEIYFSLSFRPGTRLKYTCRDGYKVEGSDALYCLITGQWSSAAPRCVRKSSSIRFGPQSGKKCANPEFISNGHVVVIPTGPVDTSGENNVQYPTGTQLRYSCIYGFKLQGSDNLECHPSGNWSAETPLCVEDPAPPVFCKNPGSILNGRVIIVRAVNGTADVYNNAHYAVGTRLHFSCEFGYALQGSTNVECLSSGYWSAATPFCYEECGVSKVLATRKITYGDRTVPGEWPWTVSISVSKKNISSIKCGGTVLDKKTVLTAAHCFLDNQNHYIFHFGKFHKRDALDDKTVQVRVVEPSQITMHPDFNKTTYENDIAIVEILPKIQYSTRVLPICLPTDETTVVNLVPGSKGYVTGWGMNENGVTSDQLLLANLPYQPDSKCNAWQSVPLVTGMFCAGFDGGNISACRGDSGSPFVFYDDENHNYVIEGLVSFGPPGNCGLPGKYTVFTKILEYVDWLDNNWPR